MVSAEWEEKRALSNKTHKSTLNCPSDLGRPELDVPFPARRSLHFVLFLLFKTRATGVNTPNYFNLRQRSSHLTRENYWTSCPAYTQGPVTRWEDRSILILTSDFRWTMWNLLENEKPIGETGPKFAWISLAVLITRNVNITSDFWISRARESIASQSQIGHPPKLDKKLVTR
jgi:hypothetical protein